MKLEEILHRLEHENPLDIEELKQDIRKAIMKQTRFRGGTTQTVRTLAGIYNKNQKKGSERTKAVHPWRDKFILFNDDTSMLFILSDDYGMDHIGPEHTISRLDTLIERHTATHEVPNLTAESITLAHKMKEMIDVDDEYLLSHERLYTIARVLGKDMKVYRDKPYSVYCTNGTDSAICMVMRRRG